MLKQRDFKPENIKHEREKERQDNPDKYFNLSLTYTDHRCAKITHTLITLLKNTTSLYRIYIIWKNNKLSKLYSPRLKLGVPILQKNCSC